MQPTMQPVVIIGAARSGTNLLRDLLCAAPDVATWRCDEINLVWRFGNPTHPNDELPPSAATPRVQKYIRRRFTALCKRSGAELIVEKTCANSLRVPYVSQILPDARWVLLVRDGRDVVSSALKRWRSPIDLHYTLRKARHVPLRDAPYYAYRFALNRAYQAVHPTSHLREWGPRFASMQNMLKTHSLAEVCAEQWAQSVLLSDAGLAKLDADRVFRLSYEKLVSDPSSQLALLADFLGLPTEPLVNAALATRISTGSIGAWRRELGEDQQSLVRERLEPTLQRFGYQTGVEAAA